MDHNDEESDKDPEFDDWGSIGEDDENCILGKDDNFLDRIPIQS